MNSEEFSLTWKDHHSTLVGVFEMLLENNTLVDCTIAAEGQYLKAHKIVLSACSPYFELLFNQESEKNPIVVLKDIKFQELKSMIDFVYRGRVKISEDRLADFVAAAESLQIKGLGCGHQEIHSKKCVQSPSLHVRGCSVSAVSQRLVGNSGPSDNEKSNSSSLIGVSNEGNSCDSVLKDQNSLAVDMPVSVSSVLSDCTTSPSSILEQGVNIQKDLHCVRTELSSSCIQSTQISLPKAETGVSLASTETAVKTELEPITEVFLPESECVVEPKDEVCLEEVPLFYEQDDIGNVAEDECLQNSHNINLYCGAVASAARADPDFARPPLPGAALASTPPKTRPGAAVSPPPLSRTHAHPQPDESPRFRVQKGERLFVCRLCGKSFWNKSNWKKHEKAHTGQRPFRCPVCSKAFMHRCDLERHQRVHTGERPYVCQVCSRAFVQRSDLDVHQRVHTGERPFACRECGKTFSRKGNMQAHMRLHAHKTPLGLHYQVHLGERT